MRVLHFKAFFDAHPRFAERFPGGIVQFAQVAGELPDEFLEDMMIAEVGMIPAGDGRGMPGEMPGQEILLAENEGDQEELPPLLAEDPDSVEGVEEGDEEEGDDEDEDEEDIAVRGIFILFHWEALLMALTILALTCSFVTKYG
jgi:hypothetical protein